MSWLRNSGHARLRRLLRASLVFSALWALLTVASVAWADERSEPLEIVSADVVFVVDAPAGMGSVAQTAAEIVEESWPAIAEAAGALGPDRIEVSIEREIDDWFTRREQPPRNPEWAAGLAIPSQRVLMVKSSNPEWKSTLRHELAHLAVGLAAGDGRPPRWFDEGFAVATAEQWSLERSATMIRAGLTGNFYDFSELRRGFPPAASSADLAYAQSFHFVRFVRDRHGADIFRKILREMRVEGASWDAAFLLHVGRSEADLETVWAEYVTTRYKWAPAIGGGGSAWSFMAGLSIIAWRRSKRRARRRLAALQAAEGGVYAPDPDDETFG